MRILFILKFRDNPYHCDPNYNHGHMSSGLWNSARFVQEMLRDVLGYEAFIVHAKDNNCIDRLVTQYKADIVVIEAYWVVPEKFEVLTKLHPKVTWVVRNHSPMPFASMEGIVVDWSLRYMDYPNVILACNDLRADREFRQLIAVYKPNWEHDDIRRRCVYLPNYYPVHYHPREFENRDVLDIGCFGAVRPLKNQLMQAVAAVEYAGMVGKKLRFHINATRIEGRGDAILNNIKNLFKNLDCELVEHPWLSHHDFIKLVRKIDVSLQVSYSESFNIVTADMVVNGVPVVVSSEISWVDPCFRADPNDSKSIVKAIDYAMKANESSYLTYQTINNLHSFDMTSIELWEDFIHRHRK
jgi:hypothetical protein